MNTVLIHCPLEHAVTLDMSQQIGYFGFIFVILIVILVLAYPFAQEYAKPIASLIFPIADDNSLVKNILVISAMYWGMVGTYLVINRKQ